MRGGEQGNDKAGYSEKGRNRVRMPEVQNTDPTLPCACPKYGSDVNERTGKGTEIREKREQ